MSHKPIILSGCFALVLSLQLSRNATAQTLLPTLQSVSCTTAVVLAASAIGVDIYDGPGALPIATNVSVTGGASTTSITLPAMQTAGAVLCLLYMGPGPRYRLRIRLEPAARIAYALLQRGRLLLN